MAILLSKWNTFRSKKEDMKPILMRHIEATNKSFKAWKNFRPYAHNPWHYHPEIEITYINKGRGILFVGDKILNYGQDELVMIGKNLPHEWRSSVREEPDNYSESVAVHFKRDFIGESFYTMPEIVDIKELLNFSERGIIINDSATKKKVKRELTALLNARGIQRMIKLFEILDWIAKSSNANLLSSPTFINSINDEEADRMNTIYKFIMTSFKEKIFLDDIAKEVGMSKASFCRFFKTRTNKSFMQYVNEVRVGFACKLLIEKDYTISSIAYDSGFENISNFNKQFKKVKGRTPTEYLNLFDRQGDITLAM